MVVAVAGVALVHRQHAFALVAVALVLVAAAAAVVDRRERRIPNQLVLVGLIVTVGLVAVSGVVDHRPVVAGALTGVLAYAGPLLALHLASPGGIGFGDVKLGVVFGLGLGCAHPILAALALLAACLAAVVRRAVLRSWRTPEPFAPAMAAGLVVVLLVARPMVVALGFGWF